MAPPASPALPVWPIRRVERDPLAFLTTLASTDRDVVPFLVGRRPAFLLNHPARIEDVLIRQSQVFVKGRGFDRARHLLGNGLLTAAGPVHRDRRRLVQGAFHRQRVEAHTPTIVDRALRRRETWRAGTPIDAAREMRELTLTIAGEALFGADLTEWAGHIERGVALAVPPMDGLVAIVAPPGQTRRARRGLEVVIDAIIAGRRAVPARRDDLLAMLLDVHEEKNEASERQLRDDVLTVLLAGHDTISHALTWTWLLLADHPDVDERLGAELAMVLGARLPEAGDVARLLYTRAVVAEALRLFPPAWVIVRRAAEACRVGKVEIPKGAVMVASPFVTQRDPRFFHEPLRFTPDRWLPTGEDAVPLPKLAYFPFGAGTRACVGEGFAWLEATLVLATLAQHWRLARSTNSSVEASARITLRPSGEPPMVPMRRSLP
jgi:cytochrome P450